jgi:glycerol-3-phosphate acyltransferase PlsX
MNIGLDMMGGDFAPREAVKSLQLYLSGTSSPATLFLIGDEALVAPLLSEFLIPAGQIRVVHASQVIGMHEHPTKALKEKPASSISIGFQQLATGKIDAFISAGNTGAMLVGALYSIKALPGVLRPTISSMMPKENGNSGLVVDVGLNSDCKPEQLNQFAVLGSLYSQYILGTDKPRVALLNMGEEEGKGNILAQGAYPLLKANDKINFIGNIEGRDVFLDKADVMVCDGFTGNVVLKLAESIYDITKQKQIEHEFLDRFNFENYGGTPVLGVSKPVIIGHGISHAKAFSNMIRLAEKMIATDLISRMKENFLASS